MSMLPPPNPAQREGASYATSSGFRVRFLARFVGGIILINFSMRNCPIINSEISCTSIGVKVVDIRTGNVIGVPRAIGRFFGQYISTWPSFLGYLWMLWDKDKQTWHDKMVNSVVVRI